MAAGKFLAELHLEEFEPAFGKLGAETLQELAQVRYEELLEMGLSKVQCCLFLEKISSLAGVDGSGIAEEHSALRVTEVRDEALANDLAESAARAGEEQALGITLRECVAAERRSALRQLMPPPAAGIAFDEDASLGGALRECFAAARSTAARSSRKRPHSSHLSTGAARGSEFVSTAGSASGSSSSSYHPDADVRVKKRRVDRQRILSCSDLALHGAASASGSGRHCDGDARDGRTGFAGNNAPAGRGGVAGSGFGDAISSEMLSLGLVDDDMGAEGLVGRV
jgi:hypothetical protein